VETAPRDRTRVLFITSPLTIGADTWIHLLLLRHLPRDRFELHAAGQPARPDDDERAAALEALYTIPGVAVRVTDFGPSLFGRTRLQKLGTVRAVVPATASLLGLVRYIRRHRIQILHATDRPRDAITCAVLGLLTGAKSVIHVHVKYDDWMSPGQRWALRRADAVVGVSRFVADSLMAGGCKRERVHAVLNAIDPMDWDASLGRAQGRAALGVAADAPLILSVGRLFAGKGHSELIRALALVKREAPNVRLAIVGADYPEGSGTTRALSQLAEELGVRENVIFTGPRKDVPVLLAASDIFALSSFEEPFGLVYAEAMAMKRPVIALAEGGTLEVVEHGKSGLLATPEDIPELSAHLLTLIRDPALRARMGEYGRRKVEESFTPERMASDFTALYARLLS
jgi:glycosyltransferase involved in cell wall biosynthesis